MILRKTCYKNSFSINFSCISLWNASYRME